MISAPVFFPPALRVRMPSGWSANIVGGKVYDLEAGEGERLLRDRLERAGPAQPARALIAGVRDEGARYGKPQVSARAWGKAHFASP
jgi:hypothetical protein